MVWRGGGVFDRSEPEVWGWSTHTHTHIHTEFIVFTSKLSTAYHTIGRGKLPETVKRNQRYHISYFFYGTFGLL